MMFFYFGPPSPNYDSQENTFYEEMPETQGKQGGPNSKGSELAGHPVYLITSSFPHRSHFGSSHFLFEISFFPFVFMFLSDTVDDATRNPLPASPLPAGSSNFGSPNGSVSALDGIGVRSSSIVGVFQKLEVPWIDATSKQIEVRFVL